MMTEAGCDKTQWLTKEKKTIQLLMIDSIHPNPMQPRKQFDEENMHLLANSIRQYGLLSPVSVRRDGDAYLLIAGQRRLTACKALGMEKIEAIILPAREREAALIALIENLQREDLHYLDEAESYGNTLNEFSMSQEELSQRIGKSQSTISNKLRLLKLDDHVRATLRASVLSQRHARALLKLTQPAMQMQAINAAIQKDMTVRELERYIDRLLIQPQPKKNIFGRFYDCRIFIGEIKNVVQKISEAGVDTKFERIEKDDSIELRIILKRKDIAPTAGGSTKAQLGKNNE